MSISLIGKSISESATLKLNEIAAILRAKGEPVIHLGGGEPKSKAPLDAVIAATNIINTAEVRYTPADGIPALKQAIIRYTEDFYNRKVEPENIIASSGAKQAIMVALQTILNPQEEVIYPAPYWVSYPEMIKLCGGIPVPVYAERRNFLSKTSGYSIKGYFLYKSHNHQQSQQSDRSNVFRAVYCRNSRILREKRYLFDYG